MNKADLVARVSETTGLPKATTEVAVNTIFTALTDGLAQGDSIAIAGFGTHASVTVTAPTFSRSVSNH